MACLWIRTLHSKPQPGVNKCNTMLRQLARFEPGSNRGRFADQLRRGFLSQLSPLNNHDETQRAGAPYSPTLPTQRSLCEPIGPDLSHVLTAGKSRACASIRGNGGFAPHRSRAEDLMWRARVLAKTSFTCSRARRGKWGQGIPKPAWTFNRFRWLLASTVHRMGAMPIT